MTTYPGDPLTPGVGATEDAKRLTREDAPTILKIPVLPISYADARSPGARSAARSSPAASAAACRSPITGAATDAVKVHLAVKSDWSLKPIYDVIAMLRAPLARPVDRPRQPPRRLGDGRVRSADRPGRADGRGQGARAALPAGWRPERTIVYASWDGEEPGLLGSTEWAETHADELKRKAVLYINTDNNGRGFLCARAATSFSTS